MECRGAVDAVGRGRAFPDTRMVGLTGDELRELGQCFPDPCRSHGSFRCDRSCPLLCAQARVRQRRLRQRRGIHRRFGLDHPGAIHWIVGRGVAASAVRPFRLRRRGHGLRSPSPHLRSRQRGRRLARRRHLRGRVAGHHQCARHYGGGVALDAPDLDRQHE